MSFYLKISSKDEKVLNQFIKLLLKLKILPISLKHVSKQKKRKFFTVLNSPHVNKTAQEQFEFRIFKYSFITHSFNKFFFLLLLKKVKSVSFAGLKLGFKNLINAPKNNYQELKKINPDYTILSLSEFSLKKLTYIELFDSYGEVCLKNLCLLKEINND